MTRREWPGFIALLTMLTLILCVTPALAHHSTAMFDTEHPIEISGTVVEWQFSNPHCFIMLDVSDTDGQTVRWSLEGLSPNLLYRQGWTPKSLQAGDRIMATVRPLHSGAPGGNYGNLRWGDGSVIDPKAARPAQQE
ncbi:MAG: DUF6152 family protein [Pseudomonadales bacterium]|nr:DUF6152 family protein [Pseudomonadales bacterium]